jgi:DNA-binding transcriptional regulator YiaG
MTDADRLRDTLARLQLSQRGLARALDLDERIVRRWCAGQDRVPRVVWLAIDALVARAPLPPVH